MMKKSHLIVLTTALCLMGLTACSSSSDVEENNPNVVRDDQGQAGVKPEFVISIPQTVVNGKTRMSDEVTQSTGTLGVFRGMDHIRLIPFSAAPTLSSSKLSNIMSLSSIQSLKQAGTDNFKVYANQFVPFETQYFLFYGKAIDNTAESEITLRDEKFTYGTLIAKGLNDTEFTNVGSISFSLEQINTSEAPQADNAVGKAIVALMTDLARTTAASDVASEKAWKTSTNVALSRLYKNFIGTTVSSSHGLAAILGMINDGVDRVLAASPTNALALGLKEKIKYASSSITTGMPVTLKSDYANYPANIGLPDGAVRVRWDGASNQFVDISANYNMGMKNIKLTDYVYPAALWYYSNTPLRTSTAKQSDNYTSQTSWNNVLTNLYTAGSEVGPNTQSVALVNPVAYAVGRLETKIVMENGTYYDGNGEEVVIGNKGYTLTGLLLGGQNTVNYEFSQKGGEGWTIYDCKVPEEPEEDNPEPVKTYVKPGKTTIANQTLALETKTDGVVYAALELVNNGEAFTGFDGIIPAGGTFYLTVALNPKAATGTTGSGYDATTKNKIVMKDHVTKLTITIKKGSNTPPDRNGDGNPDKYVFDANGVPVGVDANGDGEVDPYDIDGDGVNDTFVTDASKGGPGWDINGDGIVDLPVLPIPTSGEYPKYPNSPGGLGNATNGIPDLSAPGIELGTSVDLVWKTGLELTPSI